MEPDYYTIGQVLIARVNNCNYKCVKIRAQYIHYIIRTHNTCAQ